jgi:gas vesicle protein
MPNHDTPNSTKHLPPEERGGFLGLALLAAAVGAGAALLLAPARGSQKRKDHSRREKRIIALAGVLVGVGLTALLTPESGPATRKLIGGTLSRIKVGAVDRIGRLRQTDEDEPAENPVRSVQELGRDPNDIF